MVVTARATKLHNVDRRERLCRMVHPDTLMNELGPGDQVNCLAPTRLMAAGGKSECQHDVVRKIQRIEDLGGNGPSLGGFASCDLVAGENIDVESSGDRWALNKVRNERFWCGSTEFLECQRKCLYYRLRSRGDA